MIDPSNLTLQQKQAPALRHAPVRNRGSIRDGFTLLELLLALALSVVVVLVLSAATNLYIGTVTRQQRRVETNEIARSVATVLHNDIRAAIQYKPGDFSGLENLVASQQLISGITTLEDLEAASELEEGEGEGGDITELGDQGAGGGFDNGGFDNGDTGNDAGTAPEIDTGGDFGSELNSGEGENPAAEEEEEEPESEECVSCRPTLIGTSNSLLIDISRLPRIDQISGDQADQQLPSDVKATTFFISQEAPPEDQELFLPLNKTRTGGLYRRQIDRAIAAGNNETGIIQSIDEFADLVAPEVVAIEFRYWDGESWSNSWDSEERNGFPSAIEVWMEIDLFATVPANQAEATSFRDNSDRLNRYRTVIHLPAAEILPEEDE